MRSRVTVVFLAAVVITASASVIAPLSRLPVDTSVAAQSADPIAELAADLDYDVENIFEFVAREIRYEPYVGWLRGARGTLEARAGNSVDQSVLLAALLDASLVPRRFAQGTIDAGASAALLEAATIDQETAQSRAAQALTPEIDESDVPASVTPELDAGDEATVSSEIDALVDSADREIVDTAAMIESALLDAGVEVALPSITIPRSEQEAHTWVQVASGAEWVELDPSFATTTAGSTPATMTVVLDALDDSLRHRVSIRALVERVAGDDLVTDQTLEYTGFADELHGVPITFGHLEPSGAEAFGLGLRMLTGDGALSYIPTLDAGTTAHVGDVGIEFGASGSDGGGGLFADADFLDSESTSNALADGEATAEWLEVTVERPDREPLTVRRTVFDRVAPQARHDGEPSPDDVAPLELIRLEGSGGPDFAPMLGMESIVIATGPIGGGSLEAAYATSDTTVTGVLALAYHNLRDGLAVDTLLRRGVNTYLAGPNVASFALEIESTGAGPDIALALDVWHTDLQTLPVAGQPSSGVNPGIVAGVLPYVAERTAFEADREPTEAAVSAGVGHVFEAAVEQGVPTAVLSGSLTGQSFGREADARIEQILRSGSVVVIPASPVSVDGQQRIGWWSIDPADGTTWDSMADGAGSESASYAGNSSRALHAGRCVVAMAPAIFGALLLHAAYRKSAEGGAVAGTGLLLFDKVLPKIKALKGAYPKDFKC